MSRRPHTPLSLCALLLSTSLLATPGAAQLVRLPDIREPLGWGSLSVGLLQIQPEVVDGTTRTVWDFGSTAQYRGSLEYAIANQSSVGLTASFARAPLRYYDLDPGLACEAGCDAHADIWSAFASFHAGGSQGFHQVIDIVAGATRYDRFESKRLGPLRSTGDTDFAFGLGYGFGYGLSKRFQIMLVQDYDFVLHQRENLPGNASTRINRYVTRFGVRYGLGTKHTGLGRRR